MLIIHHKLLLIFLTISCLVISLPVRADEQTKDLAIGLGAGLLLKGIEAISTSKAQETSNKNNVQNEQSSNDNQHVNSKAKIEYSEETAQVQSNLKDLGYYHGSIDGLKGQQTYKAIESWRTATNSEDTGEMDFIERDVLNDRAKTARENKAYENKKRRNAKSPKQHKKRLAFSYRKYFSEQDKMQICSDFKNSPHLLAPSIDDDIDNNFKYARKRFKQELEIMPDCYKISETEAQSIKSQELEKYKNSDIGKRNEMALLLKHRIDDSDAMARVQGCNNLSRRMFLFKSKNETPSCKLISQTFEKVGL